MSRILITDGGYSHTLSIIRSLESQGHIIDCIGHPLCLSSFSRSLNKCAYKQSLFKQQYMYDFLSFLEENKYDFLIPIGADSVNLINKNRKEIQKKVLINLAPFNSINICLEKPRVLALAKKIGIPTPKNYKIDDLHLESNNEKRFVVKAISELANNKVLYLTKKEILDSCFINNKNFLIQDYISGPGLGFFAIYDNGELKSFFMHRRIRENPITGGSSVCAESIFNKRLYKYGKKLLDELHWHGVAMVEFKQDINNKELFLMEVNPKFWASHDLAIASGINFAEKYLEINPYKKTNLKKISSESKYEIGKKFQWLARDISSSFLRPKRLVEVFYYYFILKANNNLHIKDPLCSIYLILYAFFGKFAKNKIFRLTYNFLWRIKSFGFKTALIRTFTEVSGIPIKNYSFINKNIAIGMQPSKLGLIILHTKGFRYILNLRSEYSYKKNFNKKFNILQIPVKEYHDPTIKQLEKGADYINKVLSTNSKIYIHCREGISRAPCFAIAYFIKYEGLKYNESYQIVLKVRYFSNLLPSQIDALLKFESYIKENY